MLFYFMAYVVLCASSSSVDESENVEYNSYPCMTGRDQNACQKFLTKHLNQNAPTTLDQNLWQDFIQNHIKTCDRPVQSFLPVAQQQAVLNVCSPTGGKRYSGNLCVSNNQFSFIIVYVNNSCIVTRVRSETKYIILGCVKVNNYCCPVHFESNPSNAGPAHQSTDCEAPSPPPPLQEHLEFRLPLVESGVSVPALGLLIFILLTTAFILCKCLSKTKDNNKSHKD